METIKIKISSTVNQSFDYNKFKKYNKFFSLND